MKNKERKHLFGHYIY